MTQLEIANLKIECLKIALQSLPESRLTPDAVLAEAKKIYDFAKQWLD